MGKREPTVTLVPYVHRSFCTVLSSGGGFFLPHAARIWHKKGRKAALSAIFGLSLFLFSVIHSALFRPNIWHFSRFF